MDDKIIYSILADGTCSYCGRDADLVELPDGDVTTSDTCDACDEYNNEALLIEQESGQFTGLWFQGYNF